MCTPLRKILDLPLLDTVLLTYISVAFEASEALSAHKKGLGTPLSSGHKLQSPSKKFEAPGKQKNFVALNNTVTEP